MAKQNNAQTLKTTVMQKEFWVGLVTTFIVLLVAFKLIPWNNLHQLTTNKAAKVVSPVPSTAMTASNGALMTRTTSIPTGESIGESGATTATNSALITKAPATSEAAMNITKSSSPKKKVSTLADTTGTSSYIVQDGDNYYTISVKVCGDGKYFESIQADNNYASLYAGNEVIVNCAE